MTSEPGSRPRISTVVPAFNAARYISRALESIFEQTISVDEIVVVDDGSTDGTPETVLRFAERGVRLVRQENAGPSAARNHGVAETEGELLAFLDADDEWLPEKTAKQLACFAASPELVLVGGSQVWWDVTRDTRTEVRRGLQHGNDPLREIAVRNFVGNASGVIVRRDAFLSAGGFDPVLRHAEDWELWTRLLQLGPIVFVDEPVVVYREHAEANTNRDRWEQFALWEEITARAAGRVRSAPRRAVVRARARSNVTSYRARHAIAAGLPRRSQVAYAMAAFLAYPFEDAPAKLTTLARATLGEAAFRRLRGLVGSR